MASGWYAQSREAFITKPSSATSSPKMAWAGVCETV